ncbi:MAG: TolC family protein [Bacteroidales bacterium]|nr:TolC family protein [Bacteroidales bacterium]
MRKANMMMSNNIKNIMISPLKGILAVLLVLLTIPGYGQEQQLSQSEAINRALGNNYGIIISDRETEIAGINNNPGDAGRYPSIGFDLSSLNNQNIVDNQFSSRLNAGAGLRWTIFNGYRVNLTMDKLGQLEELSMGRAAVVIENTIEDVILAYYNVLLQEKRLEVLVKVMNLSEDRYKYEMNRQSIGNAVTYNVLQAKNNWLNDKAAYINQEVILRNSVRNLNFLLGEEPGVLWTFTEKFSAATDDYVLADLLSRMLESNSSIKNQYINILLAGNATNLAKSNFYPSVSLSAGVDNGNTLTGVATGSATTLNSYANVTLLYDIYMGGVSKRAVEVAKINEEIAGVEEEQMKHSLTNQLFNIFDIYNVRKELYSISLENLEAAELNMQIADEKYRSGAINSFNYRDIQLIYLNAAYRQIGTVYNLISSQAELTRITGGFVTSGE